MLDFEAFRANFRAVDKLKEKVEFVSIEMVEVGNRDTRDCCWD